MAYESHLYFYYTANANGFNKEEDDVEKKSQRFSFFVVYDIHTIGAWNCHKLEVIFCGCCSTICRKGRIEHYRNVSLFSF